MYETSSIAKDRLMQKKGIKTRLIVLAQCTLQRNQIRRPFKNKILKHIHDKDILLSIYNHENIQQ